jgi:hypothetical protein
VSLVCGSSLSHNDMGKLSAVPASTLRKWALKFQMATSAALRLWQPGGTNSISNLYMSFMYALSFVRRSHYPRHACVVDNPL